MKKLYSPAEAYKILFDGARTIRYMSRAKKKNLISQEFIERIMLAVTEVNNCPACSYVHSKIALEAGLSESEIQALLDGHSETVPPEQLTAILFAQHYADSRGKPSLEAWNKVTETYGESLAKGILGAIRMIMIGNTFGIPIGSLKNRFKGKHDPRCSLSYELGMICAPLLYWPILLLHVFFAVIFRYKLI